MDKGVGIMGYEGRVEWGGSLPMKNFGDQDKYFVLDAGTCWKPV